MGYLKHIVLRFPQGVQRVDWDKGLPVDVLALVARGSNALREMRGVCKTWQEGFDLSVTGVSVRGNPDLERLVQHFPEMTNLKLGLCSRRVQSHLLKELAGASKLGSLSLGNEGRRESGFGVCFASDTVFKQLARLPLTSLNLQGCTEVRVCYFWPELRELPMLTSLSLEGYCRTTDWRLGELRGMSLTDLNLQGCYWLLPTDLESLYELPLTSLRLGFNQPYENLTGVDLERLTGLSQLKVLSLDSGRVGGIDGDLYRLEGLSLESLSLAGSVLLSDLGLASLRGFSLTSLDLSGCMNITNIGLAFLVGTPLTNLNLDGCHLVSDQGLNFLRNCPLTDLSCRGCTLVSDEGLQVFPLLTNPCYPLDFPQLSLPVEQCHC